MPLVTVDNEEFIVTFESYETDLSKARYPHYAVMRTTMVPDGARLPPGRFFLSQIEEGGNIHFSVAPYSHEPDVVARVAKAALDHGSLMHLPEPPHYPTPVPDAPDE